jgi:hypothetical protein
MLAIGVSYEVLRVATIHPQPHDVPMDFVITEAAVYTAAGGTLVPLDPALSREREAQLLRARGSPAAGAVRGGAAGPGTATCYAGEFPGYFGDKPARD